MIFQLQMYKQCVHRIANNILVIILAFRARSLIIASIFKNVQSNQQDGDLSHPTNHKVHGFVKKACVLKLILFLFCYNLVISMLCCLPKPYPITALMIRFSRMKLTNHDYESWGK